MQKQRLAAAAALTLLLPLAARAQVFSPSGGQPAARIFRLRIRGIPVCRSLGTSCSSTRMSHAFAFFLLDCCGGFRRCCAALRGLPGWDSCQRSSCRLRALRKFFSPLERLDFDFGLQLPWLCSFLPGTGSYPGQRRVLLVFL